MNKLNSMTSIAALLALSVAGVTTQVSATLMTTETHVNKSADAKCGADKKVADGKCGAK